MSVFESLLGSELFDNKFNAVPTSQVLADADAVGIYFSAHWCGPCRAFTPQLSQIYTDMKANGKKFEIVFVSSDKDDNAFRGYAAEMPWHSLPFADRDRKGKLSKKYKVNGIPTLVIVDKNGNTITTDGREAVSEDPKGNKFPWLAPTFEQSIGTDFIKTDGSVVTVDELKGKILGIYFSAHWCPPCRMFTPQLVEWYKKAQEKHAGKFEIVFVSSDRDQSAFNGYHGEMPWLAVPFSDTQRKADLNKLYEVQGIPSFVIVDPSTGKVINANGRGAVGSDPDANDFPWAPKPVQPLSSPDGINEATSLVVLAESADEATKKSLLEDLTAVAVKAKAETGDDDDEPLFFFADTTERISTQVRGLVDVTETSQPVACILDLPSGCFYVSDKPVDAQNLQEFWTAFKSGSLTPQSIRK